MQCCRVHTVKETLLNMLISNDEMIKSMLQIYGKKCGNISEDGEFCFHRKHPTTTHAKIKKIKIKKGIH